MANINLRPGDRGIIWAEVQKRKLPFAVGRRYLLILAVTDGMSVAHASQVLLLDEAKCWKWIKRYNKAGLGGLQLSNHKPPMKKPAPIKERYGHWTVLGQKGPKVFVQCKCGNKAWRYTFSLKNGSSTQCQSCARKIS